MFDIGVKDYIDLSNNERMLASYLINGDTIFLALLVLSN